MPWSDIDDDITSYTHPCSCEDVLHYQLHTVVPRGGEGGVPGHMTRCRGNRQALEQGVDRSSINTQAHTVYIHTRMHVCTHARTHTHTHTHMCTCTHTHLWSTSL